MDFWTNSATWLIEFDGPYPFGDLVYVGGLIVCGIITISEVVSQSIYYAKSGKNKSQSGVNNTGNNNKGKNKKPKKRTTPGAMQRQVEKGHAPREVKEVHNGHTKNGKPHVHFKDGTAINLDGTKSHDHAGTPPLTNAIKEWLHQNGHLRMIK